MLTQNEVMGAVTASDGGRAPIASFWVRIMMSCINIREAYLSSSKLGASHRTYKTQPKLSHKCEWNTKNIALLRPISNDAEGRVGYETQMRYIFSYSTNVLVITSLSSSLTWNVQSLKLQNIILRRTACKKFRMQFCHCPYTERDTLTLTIRTVQ